MNTVTNLNIIPLQHVDISLHIQITTGPLKAHLLTLFNIKTPLFEIKPTFEMLKNA